MNVREGERGYDGPGAAASTIPELFEAAAERHGERPAQQFKGGVYDRSLTETVVPPAPDGEFRALTYGDVRQIVHHLAAGFRDLGVDDGTRVAIYAHTRMEWAQSDLALLSAGGVVSTVYPSSTRSKLEYLLSDADASGVVVENGELLERVLEVEDRLDLEFVVSMDRLTGDAADVSRERDDVYTLADVHDRGAELYRERDHEAWLAARDPEDLCSLIYTSGTTGQPKGVRLTHANFVANVGQVLARFGPSPDRPPAQQIDEHTRTVSFLPLAHVFERLAGHFVMFAAGACVAYAESPDTLREDFALVSPTTATSVPRVYEKIYDAIREQASESDRKQRIFEWAVAVGRERETADSPGPILRAKAAVADALVFRSVRSALGGEIDFVISGGGSLSADLCTLFHAMGLPILEGYGLTETSPVVTCNPPEAPEVGTIGPPVVHQEILIDESVAPDGQFEGDEGAVGELLVRGPNVTDGYWNDPEATEAAFVDDAVVADADASTTAAPTAGTSTDEASTTDELAGTDGASAVDEPAATDSSPAPDGGEPWFRTGDIVHLRPDGYVEFRERAKQLLVLSTGKNVAPGPIEDAFAASDVVEQCVVVGDGRKYVAALLVPDLDRVRSWARKEGLSLPDDPEALCENEAVLERVQREVDRVNGQFDPHERIKRFALVPEEFTEENQLLTPTMKKKRHTIGERYATEIEALYEDA